MNRLGAFLAVMWNQRGPWLLETVVAGMKAEEFAWQGVREVHGGPRRLPEEG